MLFEVSAASASHPQPSPECSSSIRHRHSQRHSLTRSIQTGSDDSPGRFSVCGVPLTTGCGLRVCRSPLRASEGISGPRV